MSLGSIGFTVFCFLLFLCTLCGIHMTLLGQGLINILFGQIPQLLSNFLVPPYHVNFNKAQASYQVFQKYTVGIL